MAEPWKAPYPMTVLMPPSTHTGVNGKMIWYNITLVKVQITHKSSLNCYVSTLNNHMSFSSNNCMDISQLEVSHS